ncbi:MAG TPA: site-specific integrase [Arachidicoccus sp.]|nr:site-specific integrase [Arachidicoccus sp.]
MNFLERLNKKGDKILFYYDYGREKGQRPSTGIFAYVKPKTALEKAHNKEARAILKVKAAEAIIENPAIGTGYIPTHKFKENFLDYFREYVEANKRVGNRHLQGSLRNFRLFINKDFLHPSDITENLCRSFRRYLLDHFNGETPADYYAEFRRVLDAATSDHYYKVSPSEKVFSQKNPSTQLKDFLEVEEFLELLTTPCPNEQVQLAFIFCCYTGLRWVDVKPLRWSDINGSSLTTRIIQAKTGRPITITLHPVAQAILKKAALIAPPKGGASLVFSLPSPRRVGKIMDKWIDRTTFNKHIRWSSARLTFSILLKDKNVDDPTIAYLMGHATTEQVQKTYKRHRPKNQEDTIAMLPAPEIMPYYLE